ncbi:hypothetical protein [Glycomyces artemisiae]|uniref:Uncharacterized protein n=1 Tax=Glycomyces artemisiae TaxID=1076443 RepID=A0A2T0UMV0_9ACTN|nr:hypothetical protein [Glycomyces artemisiae]PRY59263.1 hypothetical protein B0I28_104424 [Glycomyces artemisiae]
MTDESGGAEEDVTGGELPVVPTTGKVGVTVALFLFVLYLTNQGFADFASKILHDDLDAVPARGICVQQQYDENGDSWHVQVPCWSAATKAEIIEVYTTAPVSDSYGWTSCDYAGGTLVWFTNGVGICTVPH